MYNKIMVPVDLAHSDRLAKALKTASDLAKLYGASIVYVGATSGEPSSVAHSPKEYAAKLAEFAANAGSSAGLDTDSLALTLHDPAIDLDDALVDAARKIGADLVVVASHVPGLKEHIWPSHGGKLAGHATASVMVVRPD